MIRFHYATSLAIAGTLVLCPSAGAQTSSPASHDITTQAWLGGAAGVAGSSAGVVLQWEGAVAYGPFVAAYVDSRSDDFSGDTRHDQAVVAGVLVPWRRVSFLLAGGASNAMRCSGAGDQSSSCTRSRDFHVPLVRLGVQVPMVPFTALYVSTMQPTRRGVAVPTYVIGLAVGKVR
jgi:hypothetical protein